MILAKAKYSYSTEAPPLFQSYQTAHNSVIATVAVGTNPYGAAYDSGQSEVFVANEGDGTVSVISDAC